MTSGEHVRTDLDPALHAVATAVSNSELAPMVELGPEGARARVRGSAQSCAPGPEVAEVSTHRVGTGVGVRLYRPSASTAAGTIVHFHGGGWVTGDLDYADATCRMLADEAGVAVVSVDYRLAPEHPFPAAIDDAASVMDWVAAGSESLTGPVVVSGDSAGGNLAAVCAARSRTGAGPDVIGQVLIYPVVDTDLGRESYAANSGVFLGTREMAWFLDHYCPDAADRSSPLVSPLRDTDLSGLPPTVVVVGGHDPLRDEGAEYAERLTARGVAVELLEFPSLPHGFLQFTGVSAAAADAAARIVRAAAALFDHRGAQERATQGGVHA